MTVEELIKHVKKALADSHYSAPEIRDELLCSKVVSLVNSCVFDQLELRKKEAAPVDAVAGHCVWCGTTGALTADDIIEHVRTCTKSPLADMRERKRRAVMACAKARRERDELQVLADGWHKAWESACVRVEEERARVGLELIDRMVRERDAALRKVEEWKTLHATVAGWHTKQREEIADLTSRALDAAERAEAIEELEQIRLRCFALHTRIELDRDTKSARRELDGLHKRRKELLAKHAVKHV